MSKSKDVDSPLGEWQPQILIAEDFNALHAHFMKLFKYHLV